MDSVTNQSPWRVLLLVLAGSLSIAYYPPFSSNQLAYFIPGLAAADEGLFPLDWLLDTTDPFPLFSLIVQGLATLFSKPVFYLAHFVLSLVYFFGLYLIIDAGRDKDESAKTLWGWVLLLLLHTPWLSYLFQPLSWLQVVFTAGVADQYLLGPVFQPSSFGVFLLLFFALMYRPEKPWPILLCLPPAIIHPSYIPMTMLLATSIAAWLWWTKKLSWQALWPAAVTMVVCVFSLAIYLIRFADDAELAKEARRILVEFRVPHHSKVVEWWGYSAFFQFALITGGLFLARRRAIFFPFLALYFYGMLGTLAQLLTESHSIALLFPWRVSVLLVPLSTALLIKGALDSVTLAEKMNEKTVILKPVIALIAIGGIAGSYAEWKNVANHPEVGVSEYVAEHREPDWHVIIPLEMEFFRLKSGASVFVDFKAHPYKPSEFIEWKKRIENVGDYVVFPKGDVTEPFNDLIVRYEITHLILDKRHTDSYSPTDWPVLYEDEFFLVKERPR